MTKNQLNSAKNDGLQAFTILPQAVKDLLKANRSAIQRYTKDRVWVANGSELLHSNGIYRLNPATRTDPVDVTFAVRANDSGDFRAVDPEGKLSGYTTLAHLAAKRGFKYVTYEDRFGARQNLTRLDASYGKPVSVTFDAAAL